jgi:hypothetical protein
MEHLLTKVTEYLDAAEGVAPEVWEGLVRLEIIEGFALLFLSIAGLALFGLGFWTRRKFKAADYRSDDAWFVATALLWAAGPLLFTLCGYYAAIQLTIPEICALKSLIGG